MKFKDQKDIQLGDTFEQTLKYIIEPLINLSTVKKVIICGSAALSLYNIDLKRKLNDLDLIIHVRSPSLFERELNMICEKTNNLSMSDFNSCVLINGYKCDIQIKMVCDVDFINHKGFKLQNINDIIFYKKRYAKAGHTKHENDLLQLILHNDIKLKI